jgi:hypothetical protein
MTTETTMTTEDTMTTESKTGPRRSRRGIGGGIGVGIGIGFGFGIGFGPGRAGTLAALITLAALAGCASAPDRFYALSSPADEPGHAAPSDPLAPTVVVAAAAVPDLVDRPQLVTLGDGNQVAILEQQRWAEPLRLAIPRVVAEGLGRQLGAARVSTREEALRSPDCRVYLDVRRFDARRGVAVDLEALWTVSCAGGVKRSGRSVAREPVRGAGTEAIVVAQGRALGALSHDLALALRQTAPLVDARGGR